MSDSDKLPWLEPYREPAKAARAARKAPKSKRVDPTPAAPVTAPAAPSRGVPLATWLATGVVITALAVGGAFYAGRVTAPPVVETAPKVTIPVAKVDPIPMPDSTAPMASGPTEGSTAAPRAPAAKSRRTAPERARKVAAAPPPRPNAAPPMPKVMNIRFSPPPVAGRPGTVVDLGRYLSPRLAESAYGVTVGRYPYLGGLTKVVAPQPVVYGQPRLYALQLGAKNPRDAQALCANLRKIGRPCVVR